MRKFLLTCLGFALVLMAHGQSRTVTGRVTAAEDGAPLPGVNVSVKGTTEGTFTDADGKYSISVTGENAVLVFSFVGLQSREEQVGGRTVVDVQMSVDVTQLSEVVVTGAGVATEKRKLAISVESVTADKLPSLPTASIDQALIGKIAGAQIQATNGTPGSDINILLRGINTVNRGTNPMILVDGIQLGVTSLNSLDLNSVERVEVIQGAAAATIYGAQGANGVIQIFTKKGKKGKINIDISSGISRNEYLNIGNVRKANLHGFQTDASGNVVSATGTVLAQNPTTLAYNENISFLSTDAKTQVNQPYNKNLKYYDHFKMFFVPANTINNSIAISGAGDKFDYNLSASRNKQENNFRNDGGIERSNFTSNLGLTVAKGLTIRSITQLIYTKNNVNIYQKQDFGVNSLIYGIFNARPFANYELKDTDGNYAYYYGDAVGVNQTNPFYTLQYSNTRDNKVDIVQSFRANYEVNRFVDVEALYGINHQERSVRYLAKNQSTNANSEDQASWVSWYNAKDNSGEISSFDYGRTFQNFKSTINTKLDFQKDLGSNLPIKSFTQVAFDWRSERFKRYITYALGLPADPPLTASQGTSFKVQNDYREDFVTYGYLVNQKFEYDDIFGISGGFRSDYSSAFGGGSKPFTFPRGDAFVRISGFDFWDGSSVGDQIIEWKLRAAYGEAGIQPQPFDRYVTLSSRTLGSSNALYIGSGQSNPNLDVEVSKELEIGTDITLDGLKGQWLSNINFSFTYWDRSTDNAIYRVEAPPSSGVGTILDNAFSIGSNGIQASLNFGVFKGSTLSWNTTINFGKQTSEIKSVQGGGQVVVSSSAGSTNYVLKAGEKIGQLYGFILLRDVKQKGPDGKPFIPEADQGNYEVASNGYVVNKSTKTPFFTANQYSFGDPNPNFNMAFINDIGYKDWLNFGFQIDWVNGAHLYNQTKEWMYRDGIHSDYQKPITINKETGAWSAFYRGVYAERSRNGTKDYFYEDASFMRLRNVQVAVDFARLFKIQKLNRLQLVLSGRNLWTKTNYSGMDPEISSGSVNSAWDRGTDHNTMPNLKSYQATLNIGL